MIATGGFTGTGTESYDTDDSTIYFNSNYSIGRTIYEYYEEENIVNIKDVFWNINLFWFCFKNELKRKYKTLDVYIKHYRMDRLIGKREKRIGRK